MKECLVVFSCLGDNVVESAFAFFTKALPFIPLPALVEFKLIGTPKEIGEITDNSEENFVIVRLSNGQSNYDEKNTEPNGSVNMVGFLDRDCKKYVRIEFDLSTGRGKIIRMK